MGCGSLLFFFSSRRRHTRYWRDWSSDGCSSDLIPPRSLTGFFAGPRADAGPKPSAKKPVKLLGGIYLPGNPLRFDISWVDQATGRYYLAESGNGGVDVIDAENDLFLGRITGFHGLGLPDDPCGPIEGMGPSGVLVTPNNKLWTDDARGTVKVFDLTKAEPPFNNVSPIATISTGAMCRADEIGLDRRDQILI